MHARSGDPAGAQDQSLTLASWHNNVSALLAAGIASELLRHSKQSSIVVSILRCSTPYSDCRTGTGIRPRSFDKQVPPASLASRLVRARQVCLQTGCWISACAFYSFQHAPVAVTSTDSNILRFARGRQLQSFSRARARARQRELDGQVWKTHEGLELGYRTTQMFTGCVSVFLLAMLLWRGFWSRKLRLQQCSITACGFLHAVLAASSGRASHEPGLR